MKFTICSKPRLTSLVIGVGAVFAATTPAFAQRSQIEEVVVTAQHRTQSIQDVPITVTAISAEQLEAANIFDAGSLATNVPGMTLGEFAPGQSLISLRGVSSADDGAGLDNSVALFLDGIYIGRNAGINFDMFDLERIEVLKGPQGALFGRNAIGGAINVVTQKPSEEMLGKAAVTVGNEGILRYQGMYSGPLSDNLSGKLVVNHREHDGFVRNTLLNEDVQDEDQTSLRGQLMWRNDNSEWLLSADYMDDDRKDAGRAPIVNGNFDYVGAAQTLGAGRPGTNASPVYGFNLREASGISLQGDIGFANGKITTITGLRNVETDWEMQSVGAPLGGGFNLAAGVFGLDVVDDIEESIDTFSQEIRWTSELDGKFNYVAGLYYFTEDTDRQEQFRIDRNTVATGQIVVGNEWTRTQNETTSYAIYGQGSYDFNDEWKLTVGARFTKDERDYIASATNCGLSDEEILSAGFASTSNCVFGGNRVGSSLGIIAEAFIAPASDDWDDFSPMASLQYRPNENVMYFGTVSTGYKSGGFAGSQGVQSAATNPVNPEGVTNIELGFKGDFLDNTLRVNGTLFSMDYEDLQVVRFGPVPSSVFGTFQTTNIGSADITGLELDFTWYATEQFRISGNYAYLDAEANDLVLDGFNGPSDYSGLPLRQSPENTYNLVLEYSLPTSVGEYDFRVQYSHTDSQHFDFVTFTETIADEADIVDVRMTWSSEDDKYSVALWGQNVTDEEYVAHAYRIGPGTIGVWGAPATYGVTGTVNF
ncbi:MAG: iron complex outermembrane receptor protein [Cryomorphaceae bacterium]|jgi:iron complex outermembrane receptor protein